MLQAMLAKRFMLIAHWATKEMPIYALVRAKEEPKASRLHEVSSEPCPTGPPPTPAERKPGKLPDPTCGQIIYEHGTMKAQRAPASSIAGVLSGIMGRTVVDRTGLTGRYDFTLEWNPEDLSYGNGFDPATSSANAPGPSIFTSLQEQLGLRLDSQRGPVDVLFIDHAEKALDNFN